MTAPNPANAGELIKQSIGHLAEVTVMPPAGVPYALDLKDAEVTFTDAGSPSIILTGTSAATLTEAQYADFDPRKRCRVIVKAGYRTPAGGEYLTELGNLGLRQRNVDRPGEAIRFSAACDEARVRDHGRYYGGEVLPAGGLVEKATYLIQTAISPEVPVIVTAYGANYQSALLTDFDLELGQSFIDPLLDMASACDARIYCDSANVWHIDPLTETAGAPVHLVEPGAAGTLISSNSVVDRENWFNAAILSWHWANATGEETIIAKSRISGGEWGTEGQGFRTYMSTKRGRRTQAQADAIARKTVRNLSTRGRSLTVTAHAAYWIRPTDTVTVQLQTGEPVTWLVQRVQFLLGRGQMVLTLRQPLDVTTIEGE